VRIRTRLFLGYFVIVAAGFYYLLDWIVDDLRPRYLESMEESLVDTANILSVMFTDAIPESTNRVEAFRSAFNDVRKRRFSALIYDLEKTEVDLRVYITDANGIVIFDSDNGRDEGEDYSQWNDVHRTLAGEYGARATRTDPDDPTTTILHVSAPVKAGEQIVGALTACKPSVSANLFISAAQNKIIIAGAAAALSVLLVGMATSTWITRPIEKLTDYAVAVRDGRKMRIPDLGKSEFGVMGRALDEMREALEGKEYVEHYVQTLTHELKGPLTAIRGAAELMHEDMEPERRERFLRNVQVETARIQRIVDRLLVLSSLETRTGLRDVEDIDIGRLITELVESLRSHDPSKTIVVEELPEQAPKVRGERFLLFHALHNLVHNAVEFSPKGGIITIAVRDGAMIELTVTDDGDGIPEYAQSRIFDRFYSLRRPDTGRKSSGLGLPFAWEVAELHGGTITVENRPEGGARAIMRLPRSGDEAVS
jgi:two-component system sensor histidine kinase CreC